MSSAPRLLVFGLLIAASCKASPSPSSREATNQTDEVPREEGEKKKVTTADQPVAAATAGSGGARPRADDDGRARGGPPGALGYAPPPSEQGASALVPSTAAPLGVGASAESDALGQGSLAPRLDPNARYATTYRPGGAALAAFDAAVAKGDIPETYKDLVGDFGGRYAPAMDAPKPAALAFKIETERAKVAPSGGFLNLRVALRSSAEHATRAQLSVHLVLDVSGSMSGPAIANARQAARSLVERLAPTDDFSMVTFSSSAEVLVADGVVGPRRAQILKKIDEVQANGGTNISAGLDLGYREAHNPQIRPDAVRIVMFLSDGHANGGDTNPTSIAERSARAFQDGIQTSAFGLGADFDARIMSSVADRGAGGYYYLADSTQIAQALAKEMDARLVPVAQAVEVRVRLRPDVVPVRVFGSHVLSAAEAAAVRQQEIAVDKQVAKKEGIARDRQEDSSGGMRFFMPAFARDDHHAMLMTLQLPAGVGERALASVEVRYKDRLRKQNVTEELPVKITYAKDDAESAASQNPNVVASVKAFEAGDSIREAEALVDAGNRAAATRLLQERAELLKRAATALSEPRLGEDALRLARLSRAVEGKEIRDVLPLAMMLRGSAYGYLR